ncbi:hypothetical protein ACHAPT_012542 [Fusarium lateritium]
MVLTSQNLQDTLRGVAQETLGLLPTLLDTLQTSAAARTARKYTLENAHRLDPNYCPSYPQPATIRVINEDTLNAAIRLSQSLSAGPPDPRMATPHVAILNFANRRNPCGGFRNGRMAQEEALCYRSSLALSLDSKHYPLSGREALYSPYVVVFRHDMAHGHRIMKEVPVHNLPVVGAITIAALYRPEIRTFKLRGRDQPGFAKDSDRTITKNKMRLSLRIAARHGHRSIVLGAFGCGVYANPPEDVAHCWLEVLREKEFQGNWWREVWFAVFDPKNDGNYEVFQQVLSGKRV